MYHDASLTAPTSSITRQATNYELLSNQVMANEEWTEAARLYTSQGMRHTDSKAPAGTNIINTSGNLCPKTLNTSWRSNQL